MRTAPHCATSDATVNTNSLIQGGKTVNNRRWPTRATDYVSLVCHNRTLRCTCHILIVQKFCTIRIFKTRLLKPYINCHLPYTNSFKHPNNQDLFLTRKWRCILEQKSFVPIFQILWTSRTRRHSFPQYCQPRFSHYKLWIQDTLEVLENWKPGRVCTWYFLF